MKPYYMTSSVSGQDGAVLPARDCPFCSHNQISRKSKRVHESLFLKIFSVTVRRFSVISQSGWNEKTTKPKASTRMNKENKNIDEFQEYILQQKPANTKVKHKAT